MQIGREWLDRGDDCQCRSRSDQNAPGAKGSAGPDGHGTYEHLSAGQRRRDPGAIIEAGMYRAANIREAEAGEPRIQCRDEGAQQYRQ